MQCISFSHYPRLHPLPVASPPRLPVRSALLCSLLHFPEAIADRIKRDPVPLTGVSTGGDGELSGMAGCCVFLLPRRPSSLGYRALTSDDRDGTGEEPSSAAVTVVVGKERREFLVDPVVLEKDLFRVLLGVARWRRGGEQGGKGGRKKRKRGRGGVGGWDGEPIFVDVDAILFEHLLWLEGNGREDEDGRGGPSLLQRDLEEIIAFYAQDY